MGANPYYKNGLYAVPIPQNDITAEALNERFKEIFRSSERCNWIVQARSIATLYKRSEDGRLLMTSDTTNPMSFVIDGCWVQMTQDLPSKENFAAGKVVYLQFDNIQSVLQLHLADEAPKGDDILVIGTTLEGEPMVEEIRRVRIPPYSDNAESKHKIITDEAKLTDSDFVATLREGDMIVLVEK